MSERPQGSGRRLDDLTREVQRLQNRVEELSAEVLQMRGLFTGLALPPPQADEPETGDTDLPEPVDTGSFGESPVWTADLLPLAGRSLLVLGGAFALRALTESGFLGHGFGASLGVVYAFLFLALMEMSARKGRLTGAVFHGLTAALIAFPLLWEAPRTFQAFSPSAAMICLAGFGGTALWVSTRWRLIPVSAVTVCGVAVVALLVGSSSGAWTLAIGSVMVLAVVSQRMVDRRGWGGLAWIVALACGGSLSALTVAFVTAPVERASALISAGELIALHFALIGIFLGLPAARALVRGVTLSPSEAARAIMAVIVGLGGVVATSRDAAMYESSAGVGALLGSVALYGLSFAFADRRSGGRQNFVLFTSLALVFALASLPGLMSKALVGIGFSVIALLLGLLGSRFLRATLSLHAAFYCVSGSIVTGLFALAWEGWVGTPGADRVSVSMLVVLAACFACSWLRVATHGRTWGQFSRAPKLLMITLSPFLAGGLVVSLLSALIVERFALVGETAVIGAVRTSIISLVAMILAALSRRTRLEEAAYLVFPVLAMGALKLVLVDFRAGNPAAMVVSLVLLGIALIVASQTIRKKAAPNSSLQPREPDSATEDDQD